MKKTNLQKLLFFKLIIVFLTLSFSIKAQIVTIGTNLGTSQDLPINSYYGNNYSQTIYLANDILNGGGGGPAYINSISYYYVSQGYPVNNWNNWEVFIKNTATTDFADVTAWETGLTPVYTGTITPPFSGGQWMTITLNTPFLWDGISNIVVGIHENSPGYTLSNSQATWGNTGSVGHRTLLFYDDTTDPDPASPPTANTFQQSFANIKFDLLATNSCSGTPANAIATTSSASVCVNTPFNISLTGNTIASGLTYQWQSSPNGSTWTNIGSPSNTYFQTISSQTATTLYRCETVCAASSATAISTAVTVNQKALLNCYCSPGILDCNGNYTVSDINLSNLVSYFPPSCTSGTDSYQNLTGTAPTISLTANTIASFGAFVDASNPAQLGAWVDFDKNGSFEPSEYTFIGTTNGSGNYSGTISVPFNVTNGLTLMRLKIEESGSSLDPCITQVSYGQTLDFLVNLTGMVSCSGAPNAGNAIATSTSVCSNTPLTLDLTGNTLAGNLLFQWQSSLNGTNWVNIGSSQNTIPYTVLNQNANTYYRCNVTCTSSTITSASNPILVQTAPFTTCYCNSGNIYCAYSNFTDVAFATINSSSITCVANGYEDFTASVGAGTVTANQTYTLSATFNGLTYNYVGAWIDFNHSGTFDPLEYIDLGISGGTTLSQTITIPYTAIAGLTTMRLKLESAYNNSTVNNLDACNNQSPNGHTIDYGIFIIAATPCSGAPTAGNAVSDAPASICPNIAITLNLTGNSAVSGVNYQWQQSTDGITWTNLGLVQTTIPYVVNSQTTASYYRCLVSCLTATTTNASTPIFVDQNQNITCYCIPPNTNCNNGDQITNIVFGTLSNNTSTATCTPNGYNDYTSSVPTATFAAGTSNLMNVDIGYDFNENVSVWIDFDHSGTFDNNEYTFLGATTGSGNYTVSGNVTIVPTASLGVTRMRVRNIYNQTLYNGDACNTPINNPDFFKTTSVNSVAIGGETEDYSIYIAQQNCGGINLPPINLTCVAPTVCVNNTTQLNVTTILNYSGLSYEFKYSPTGSTYTTIATVTSTSTNVNPSQNTYYVCDVLCNGALAATSNSVYVSVIIPTVNVSASAYTVCPAEPVTLTASGANSYTWASSGVTTATTLITPTVTSTYSVNAIGLGGCAITNSLLITVKPATSISGVITSSAVPVTGRAVLYKYEPYFTKFDSVAGQTIGANGAYNFPFVNYGIYIVKAIPVTNTLQVTYGLSSVNWKTATTITHSCTTADVQNINVIALENLGTGTGILTGKIMEGNGFDHKPSSPYSPLTPGNPIGGIVVKGGRNPGGQMFTQTTTSSADGTYTLSGLPNNLSGQDYFILVDIPGLDTNHTYRRVITSTDNLFTGLDFVVDSTKINPILNAVGLNTIAGIENNLQMFPNPTRENVTIKYTLAANCVVTIQLYDLLGKHLKTLLPDTEQSTGQHSNNLPLGTLATGMYFVKVKINALETSIKLFITN